MKKIAAVLVVLSLLAHGLTLEIPQVVKVFYVKPTVPPTTDCPSGDSPCHSLQYYANHSSFTNNSRFLFLEGEHHLDSVVTISNVANLSLVGLSSGVEILCKSVPSGFYVKKFMEFNIEIMAITSCTRSEKNAFLSLLNGSDVHLKYFNMSGSYMAKNVLGTFSIFASTFLFGSIRVDYSLCDGPSYFNFSKSKLHEIDINIGMYTYCTGIQVVVEDSTLYNGELHVYYSVLTNTSFFVSNSVVTGSIAFYEVTTCFGSQCDISSLQCDAAFLKITNTTFNDTDINFRTLTKMCTALIEDSTFLTTTLTFFFAYYDSGHGDNDTTINLEIKNTSFVDSGVNLNSAITLQHTAIKFDSCMFENYTNPSIMAAHSKVVFQGNNIFRNNSAPTGAGISLILDSYMYLEPHTHILFEGNHADFVGGAIYTDGKSGDPCFYHIMDSSMHNTVAVDFAGNTAGFGGSSLYGNNAGGSKCKNFNIFNTSNTEMDPSALASDPHGVCLCDEKLQPVDYEYYHTSAFPGQIFPVRLAVIGESFDGVVVGAVRAYSSSINTTVQPSSQSYDKPSCGNFNFSVNSTEKLISFVLAPEQILFQNVYHFHGTSTQVIFVRITLLDCPLGFSLSPVTGSCVCDPRLDYSSIECNINNQSFLRPANSWIGFINKSSPACNKTGVMFHPNCQIGYCLPRDVSVTSNTSDSQCEPHRTGMLCGKCEDAYSLTLGNHDCKKCSNIYLLLILPIAVAGLLLVVVLFALNLTVTEGSINGLIFYANVLSMSNAVQFSERGSRYIYTFLAWLNLDLGIATCLYDGMDGYSETWLEFVFPAYLLMIIIAIILFYRKFPALAHRVCGENAVKVIATPLLLFYTKLQRTVVTIMSFTGLEYPNDVVRYVWLYDANVEYFEGKHLYLGIAGIFILVFIILPYALCLTFFQQLQACSGHRLFQWVNKLKPVFDAYAGPYKDKYRFWTGMLLLVRTLLIILFTINYAGSVEVNLLINSLVSCALLIAQSNGIYKKWPCNFLEAFFYGQLIVFSVSAAYARHKNYDVVIVADTSITLTLIVFLAVLGYHIMNRIRTIKRYCYHLKGYADIEEDIPHSREIDSVS